MAMFDIIDAAGYGYRLAWQERRYLARLATIPALISWISIFLVLRAGWSDVSLRTTLVLLPSLFAEGWMYSHYTRLIFLDQRWPFRPSGDTAVDRQELMERAHFLMVGALTFVLFHFLWRGLMAWLTTLSIKATSIANTNASQVPMSLALLMLLSIWIWLWFLRFLWFYIPATIGYPMRKCMKDLRGMMTSVIIGLTAIVCFAPLSVIDGIIESSVGYNFEQPWTSPLTVLVFVSLVRALRDTIVGLLFAGAMAYGFYEIIGLKRGRAKNQPPGS